MSALLWLSLCRMSLQLERSAATGPLETQTRVPLVCFIGPWFSWTRDSWKSFPCHVGLNKTLVEATEGLLGLDILSNSSLSSCCGYKSVSLGWEALSMALAPGPSFGRVESFWACGAFPSRLLLYHTTLYPVWLLESIIQSPNNLCIQVWHVHVQINHIL